MRRVLYLVVVLYAVALLLAGCNGTLQVGLERTPTPDANLEGMLAVLKAENAQLATRIAEQVTPTPSPAPPPPLGRVAYVYGGDIWVKTLPADPPQRLTTDGRNRAPHWSPSGQWLAFYKERTVVVEVPCETPPQRSRACFDSVSVVQKQAWVMEADGTSVHPVGDGVPVETFAWSPVDDRLAYVTDRDGLSTISANGTDLVNLVPHSAKSEAGVGRVGRMAWNADGTLLAFEWRVLASDSALVYQGLKLVSRDGKKQVELYVSNLAKQGEAILAGWSPQGKRVLFWQPPSLTTSYTDGAPVYSISADHDASAGPAPLRLEADAVLAWNDLVAPAPARSSSLATDAVALVAGANRSTWKNKRIAVDGRLLSPANLAVLAPAWSPNGLWLAFAAMPERADLAGGELVRQELMQRRIWTMSTVSDSKLQRLTDGAFRDERPLWSAEGGYLLFARIDGRGRASLWIVSAQGDNLRQVVDELTPAPDPVGSYGHIEWEALFDWWRGN